MSTADMVMIGLAILILAFAFWPRSQAGHFVAPTIPIPHAAPPPAPPASPFDSLRDYYQHNGGRIVMARLADQHADDVAEFCLKALKRGNASIPTPPPAP